LRGLLADNFTPTCPELENRLNIIEKSLQIAACLAVLCGFAAQAGAAQPNIEETIAATKSADEAARLAAIQDLGTRGGAPAIAALTELLKADLPITRAYAARALGTVGAPAKEAAESLIALLGDSDPVVRRQAMAAISGKIIPRILAEQFRNSRMRTTNARIATANLADGHASAPRGGPCPAIVS
jgi:hypothetical protein